MKKILLLATGGTIASRPTAAGGLAPAITSEELLACVPELADLCEVSAVQVFNLDSTNVGPAQWQSIVRCIKENYDACDGFVIAHGTDTMAYTAAALSYMVQNSAKPVVLTGSQKSIYNRDTDARNNLYRAFVYAVSDGAWGVQLVFDNKVILGTRARKTRTRSFNAFSSIDYPETAVFRDTRLVTFLRRPTDQPPVRFYERLEPAVFVLRLVPGMRADIIRCWPRTTAHWCWRASASAACRAGSTARCSPPCAAGVRADGWRCLPRRSRTRAATLPSTRWAAPLVSCPASWSPRHDPRLSPSS